MKIYVGNLSWGTDDAQLEELFSAFGNVESAQVVKDRETGRSRGFGFVEIDSSAGAQAIGELNGKEVDGRQLRVNEAQAKERRPSNNRY